MRNTIEKFETDFLKVFINHAIIDLLPRLDRARCSTRVGEGKMEIEEEGEERLIKR